MIKTRKALARQEEVKLQMTLKELKVTKEKCDQLLAERNDNEQTLMDTLGENDTLRSKLSVLHSEHSEAIRARDRLQLLVDSFDTCRDEYEQTLSRVGTLERQLQDAHRTIASFEDLHDNILAASNQSLYEELVAHNRTMVNNSRDSSTVIDLTCDNNSFRVNKSQSVIRCSKNKLKNYIRVKKFITKTKKLIHKHKFFIDSASLIKQRLHLIDQVSMYSEELNNMSSQYLNDTRALQRDIDRLQEQLRTINSKYEMSQKQSKEQVLAIGKLVNSCNCKNDSLLISNTHNESLKSCDSLSMTDDSLLHVNVNSSLPICNTLMYSDTIGKGMGPLMLNMNMVHSFSNVCTPNLAYNIILEKAISSCLINENTTLVLLSGNRGTLNKRKFLGYFEQLSELKLNKVVLFTLPIIKGLSEQEINIRHNLNMTMYNLICPINSQFHNKFYLIDINKLIKSSINLTKDRYYLPNYYRRQIAESLLYYFKVTAKNLANMTAPIEQQLVSKFTEAKHLAKQIAPFELNSINNNDIINNNNNCKSISLN